MNASLAQVQNFSNDKHSRQFGKLNVDRFTKAPIRAFKTQSYNAAPSVVFAKLADHAGLNKWVPMINHPVEVNHADSNTPNQNDAGTVRVCKFGGDKLTETIMHWEEGVSYAYSVKPDKNSPAIDHLGLFTVESDGNGGSLVQWRQYFNPKPYSLKAKMMPLMMGMVMAKALKNLKKVL